MGTAPDFTAAASGAPNQSGSLGLAGASGSEPGLSNTCISRSRPASAEGAAEWVAPQSDTTKPGKWSWPSRSVRSSVGFWQAYAPLTWL
jgi:hypothetical protein